MTSQIEAYFGLIRKNLFLNMYMYIEYVNMVVADLDRVDEPLDRSSEGLRTVLKSPPIIKWCVPSSGKWPKNSLKKCALSQLGAYRLTKTTGKL